MPYAMTLLFAVVVLLVSLSGWIGQLLSAVAPRLAVRWGLTETGADVDSTFLADIRAECVWDSLVLWTLPLAATLLIFDEPSWTIFGLIGGGMYIYFAGRGIIQRLTMQHRGILVGKPSYVKTACLFLALWGATGMATTALASHQLWK